MATKSKESAATFPLRTFSNDAALVKERREHIVRCATKVFIEKGYAEANMREISQACEVSTGSLYHYFGSKEEILFAIISSASLEEAEYLERVSRGTETANSTEALKRYVRGLFKWHDENRKLTLFIYRETKSLPRNAVEHILERGSRGQHTIEALIDKGIQSGEFEAVDTRLIAHNIVMAAHSWALRGWLLKDHYDFEAYLKAQTDLLLKSLGVKPIQNHNKRSKAS